MSGFDIERLRPMIIAENGDIGAIADALRADSEDLRDFVMNTPVLRRALEEVTARLVDRSVTVVSEALADDSLSNRIAAAKLMLKTRPARRRGFEHGDEVGLRLPAKGGALTLTWLPPDDKRKPEPPLIEGKVEEG